MKTNGEFVSIKLDGEEIARIRECETSDFVRGNIPTGKTITLTGRAVPWGRSILCKAIEYVNIFRN